MLVGMPSPTIYLRRPGIIVENQKRRGGGRERPSPYYCTIDMKIKTQGYRSCQVTRCYFDKIHIYYLVIKDGPIDERYTAMPKHLIQSRMMIPQIDMGTSNQNSLSLSCPFLMNIMNFQKDKVRERKRGREAERAAKRGYERLRGVNMGKQLAPYNQRAARTKQQRVYWPRYGGTHECVSRHIYIELAIGDTSGRDNQVGNQIENTSCPPRDNAGELRIHSRLP